MKTQIRKAQVQKLRLHRETLKRLELRRDDWRLILGGSFTAPPAYHCPLSANPPLDGC